jgi:hypothetical protein
VDGSEEGRESGELASNIFIQTASRDQDNGETLQSLYFCRPRTGLEHIAAGPRSYYRCWFTDLNG